MKWKPALSVLLFSVLVSLIFLNIWSKDAEQEISTADFVPGTIQLAGKTIKVVAVNTPEARAKGLGGRAGLAPDEGMLFVFDSDSGHRFWMKDMLFSIDILWISSDGKIVDMLSRISPATYPAVFTSRAPARYVLELPAGFIEEYYVRIGDKVGM